MKLSVDVKDKFQPDPFIFEDEGRFYMYVTGYTGVHLYTAYEITGMWHYEGIIAQKENTANYWAPSVIKYQGKYYMYVSYDTNGEFQEYMHVLTSDSPMGPFGNPVRLYDEFSIDSHVVETKDGLFLWYAKNSTDCERVGTRICVDKLINPTTPAGNPVEKVVPTFDEERFIPQCTETLKWHTIEGPCWFSEGQWQYVMYSAGCYQDDTYHIGYSCAKTCETDLTKVEYIKNTKDNKFSPVIIKNEFEEGTGHHSVIKHNGQYYAIYHGRDYNGDPTVPSEDRRNMRICKLHVADGVITAERYEDHL